MDSLLKQPAIEPTQEQGEAIRAVLRWQKLRGHLEYRLAGPAGVGKTEIIKMVVAELEERGLRVGVGAFTGKAVCVLHRKGVRRAMTLHKMLYRLRKTRTGETLWMRRETLPFDVLIVDEASMVSTELYNAIVSFGIQVLYVGDPAQLEPVGENPDILKYPDFVLRQIQRQSAEHPIIKYANYIREGGLKMPLGTWEGPNGGSLTITDTLQNMDIRKFDVVLSGYNSTRHEMNKRKRKALGIAGPPMAGDSIVCLRNDDEHNVYNGMVFEISGVHRELCTPENLIVDLGDDVDEDRIGVAITTKYFGKNYVRDDIKEKQKEIPFDWGYAITNHRGQGSEWQDVLVIEEVLPEITHWRWLYTATTRARQHLTILRNRQRIQNNGLLIAV